MSEQNTEVEIAADDSEAQSKPGLFRTLWRVVKDTADGIDQFEIPVRSAALAYYMLFSIFPLLLFLIFIASELLQVGDAGQQLDELLQQVIPVPEVLSFVDGIIDQTVASRGSIGLISALALLWTASSLFANLEASLNTIWGAPRRMVYYRRLLGIAAVLVLSLLFLLAIFLNTLQAIPILDEVMPFLADLDFGFSYIVSALFFWLIYRWLPNAKVPWAPSLIGAALAAIVWQIAQWGFRVYLTSGLSNLGAVYGTLASLIGLILWAFLTGMILFGGAVLSSVLQNMFWEKDDNLADT